MRRSQSPRDMQRQIVVDDGGGYSTKAVSVQARGSVISQAVQVTRDMGSPITDPHSLDIDIIETPTYTDRKDKQVNWATGRWVIGEAAQRYDGMLRYSRSMLRFLDALKYVLLCASMRVALPGSDVDLERFNRNRNQIDGRWRRPVELRTMIAPGYYGNAADIVKSLKGYYSFIDRRDNKLYSFNVERVVVVPEGRGIYASKLYEMDDYGQVHKTRWHDRYMRTKVGVIDGGGRTTDFIVFDRGNTNERQVKTVDTGVITIAEQVVSKIMRDPNLAPEFATQPHPLEIIEAMRKPRRFKGKSENILSGRDNRPVVITELIQGDMKTYSFKMAEEYQSHMNSGQGIEALVLGGGGIPSVMPYMKDNIGHNNMSAVSRSARDMFMANGVGTLLEALYEAQNEG